MPQPSDIRSDLEFTQDECDALHGVYSTEADTVEKVAGDIVEEQIAGECFFSTRRHQLVGELFHLLYSNNVERERGHDYALVVKVPQDSATTVDETFSLLHEAALTRFGSTGYWRGMEEDTAVYEMLFYGNSSGEVRDRLLRVIEELGEDLSPERNPGGESRPGEFVMFGSIEDPLDTTLSIETTESSFPSDAAGEELESNTVFRPTRLMEDLPAGVETDETREQRTLAQSFIPKQSRR